MKRRKFIQLSVYSGAALGASFIGCNTASDVAAAPWMQPAFLSHICDATTINEIGMAYLEKNPGESKAKSLEEILLTSDEHKAIAPTSGDAVINLLLEQKIRADFERGTTLIVKGWVLAQTEARQCALFSITKN